MGGKDFEENLATGETQIVEEHLECEFHPRFICVQSVARKILK
jgi:hypothetical protein